jgi:hypothetical protein
MTKRKHFKRRVRERSAKTGESYTSALRHLRVTTKESPMTTTENAVITCSFCGKTQHEVKKLIAGPGVYICDECVGLCDEIIAEDPATPAPPALTDDVLLGLLRGQLKRAQDSERDMVRTAQMLAGRGVALTAIADAADLDPIEAQRRFGI